jgi:Asp-tRNA(Asn)/Glu-tRNA(Gln) amidotransferase A subunit family amidase
VRLASAEELTELSASAALAWIRSRRITRVELLEACLAQIQRHDAWIHAWVHLDPEGALRRAAEIDAHVAAGGPIGTLSGLPVGVKDIFNTADMPTQMGSPIWAGFTPGNDARVVHYLRMAGAVIPGKTVTAEFAVHTPGPTANPHHIDHMVGTSSSGSAAAVAARMVPVALGTQTAGSIVRPASYCGIYGMKPSFGLIPRTGTLKTTDSLDTVGFFGRTPDDLELLLETIRVRGRDYPLSDAALNDPTRQDNGNRPWRVALVRGPKWEYAETYARAALFEFGERIAGAGGAHVDELELPTAFERAHETHATIYDRTLAYYFKEEYRQHTLVSPLMYEIISRGNRISLAQYVDALDAQLSLARTIDEMFANGIDAIVALSTGGEPLRGRASMDRPDTCLIWTLCGLPVVSVPAFTGPTGLPYGAQIVARRYNDHLLLRLVRHLVDSGVAPSDVAPFRPM